MNRSKPAQDIAHTQRNALSGPTGDQEPSGAGHRTLNTAREASRPVTRRQVAQDTAHATQRTKPAHRRTGAKWLRTPHTQNSASTGHTGEQEQTRSGHHTRDTTHRAGTPVNRSQLAQDTAHTQCNAVSGPIGRQEPSGPGHRTRDTARGANTPVNRSPLAQQTAHTQRNASSGPTGEQESSGPGHRTRHTAPRANTPVNRN